MIWGFSHYFWKHPYVYLCIDWCWQLDMIDVLQKPMLYIRFNVYISNIYYKLLWLFIDWTLPGEKTSIKVQRDLDVSFSETTLFKTHISCTRLYPPKLTQQQKNIEILHCLGDRMFSLTPRVVVSPCFADCRSDFWRYDLPIYPWRIRRRWAFQVGSHFIEHMSSPWIWHRILGTPPCKLLHPRSFSPFAPEEGPADRAPKRKYSFQGPMLNFWGVLWGSIGKNLMSPLLMGKTTLEVEVGSFCSHYLQGCLYIPGA